MAEDEDRSEEGLSTTTKIVAGTAIGVAVPAAVAAGRKLIGGGNGDQQRPQKSTSPTSSRVQQASARSGSAKRSTATAKTRAGSSRSKTPTREQLYKQATRLKIEGRSTMTKAQLERAVARAKK
jgi:hypothetical protein